MESGFKLIENVMPSKMPFFVKERFAKLTLSSKRMNAQAQIDDNAKSPNSSITRKNVNMVSRSLLRDFLTDDESESEAEELNRLFCSPSSQKINKTKSSGDVNNEKVVEYELNENKSYSLENLEVSDTDVTNKTKTSDISNENALESNSYSLEKLELSDSIENCTMTTKNNSKILTSPQLKDRHTNNKKTSEQQSSESLFKESDDADIEQQKLQLVQNSFGKLCVSEKLTRKQEEIAEADTISMTSSALVSSVYRDRVSLCSHKSSSPDKQSSIEYSSCNLSITIPETEEEDNNESKCKNKQYTNNSCNLSITVPETEKEDKNESKCEKTCEMIIISDSEESVDEIVILDSDESSDSEISCNVQVSDIKPSKESLSSLANVRAERLQQFINEIPCPSQLSESEKLSYLPQNIIGNQDSVKEDVKVSHSSPTNTSLQKSSSINTSLQKSSHSSPTSTPVQKSSSLLQDAQYEIEKINISATIKIKFQMKEPQITIVSQNSPEQTTSQNTNQISKSCTPIKLSDNMESCTQARTPSNNSLELNSCNIPCDKFSAKKDNNLAIGLLTKLYGNEWQTPEVMRKLEKTMSNISLRNESNDVTDDFSNFHKNIPAELHSTKLNGNDDKTINDFKKPTIMVTPFRKSLDENEKTDSEEIVKPGHISKNKNLGEEKFHEEKFKSPSTVTPIQSTKKPKRKLFTPKYDEDDIDIELQERVDEFLNKCDSDENEDTVRLKYLLPHAYGLINKQIESVKTELPISKLKTPITKKKEKTPAKKNLDIIKTSKIPRALNFDETVSTPKNKYNFLRSLDVTVSAAYCHPDALQYRENFKAKKDELTEKLYTLYNEKVFDNKLNVEIKWNKKLLTTAGRCANKRNSNGERISHIELSEKVITSADRLRCTLIHELCHAATWIFDGEHGHNGPWKEWARTANYKLPDLPKINVCHDYDIEYKYVYQCVNCEAKSYAHSKSKKTENIICSKCYGKIQVFLIRKDKEGNFMHTPTREVKGFAKFVKENYKLYKTPERKHGEVMALLSNKFSSIKVNDNQNN